MKECLQSWMRQLHTGTRTGRFWLVLVLILLVGMVAYQQYQILALQEALQAQTSGGSTSFSYRIKNLENRSNKHGDMIHDIQNTLWQLQEENREFDWQIKQLQWEHPNLVLDHTPVTATPPTQQPPSVK